MSQRPFILDPLFRAVAVLPGVGPRSVKLYEKLLGGTKLLDLIFHRPVDVVERHFISNLAAAKIGETICVKVIIEKHTPPERRSYAFRP